MRCSRTAALMDSRTSCSRGLQPSACPGCYRLRRYRPEETPLHFLAIEDDLGGVRFLGQLGMDVSGEPCSRAG
jgi:hypothetical protein